MKEFSIEALAKIIKAIPQKNINVTFTGVSTDSRTIGWGECFFALSGENFDGHNFVADAFAKGAACAVVSTRRGESPRRSLKSQSIEEKPVLKAKNTIIALGDFAAAYRRQNNFKVVAITGSVGKTTTRQIAYDVLRRHFRVHTAPKNFNNTIGLPMTLLGADEQDEIVLTELGTDHPGEIGYLTRFAQPDIAVITTVQPAHLEGFGSMEAILKEKLSIAEGLKNKGVLIINGDNEFLFNAYKVKKVNFITFGKSDRCDIQAGDIIYQTGGSRFTINGTEVTLPLPGPGNIDNALAAWAVCSRFDINVKDFAKAVKTLSAVPMRTEIIEAGSVTIINDCYNANPASMKNALDILANFRNVSDGKVRQKRRLVFICGDMTELGSESEVFHIQLGKHVAQAKIDILLAVGKFANVVAEAAERKAHHNLQTKCFADTVSACNNLEKFVKDSDIILVKGSRASKLETVTERLKRLFAKHQVAC